MMASWIPTDQKFSASIFIDEKWDFQKGLNKGLVTELEAES